MANGKGHFGPTDRNDQTGHSGPPSKLVPNIPVGPNRNGPFHLMYQPKLPEFWVEWKAPWEITCYYAPPRFSLRGRRKKGEGRGRKLRKRGKGKGAPAIRAGVFVFHPTFSELIR